MLLGILATSHHKRVDVAGAHSQPLFLRPRAARSKFVHPNAGENLRLDVCGGFLVLWIRFDTQPGLLWRFPRALDQARPSGSQTLLLVWRVRN